MLRLVLMGILALSTGLMISCGSKEKEGEGSGDGTGVETSDLGAPGAQTSINLDPVGSDGGAIAGLSTVRFSYDHYNLTPEARAILAKNAEWIKSNTNYNLQIEGHCDSRGSNEYNMTLGERRANTVKSYLESLGIEGGRLSIVSYGEEKPIQTGESDASYAANRRANFVPVSK